MLIKRAYTGEALQQMAAESRFGSGQITTDTVGIELRLAKALLTALAV